MPVSIPVFSVAFACVVSSIHSLNVSKFSMVIPRAAFDRQVECPCVHCGVVILKIWNPSCVFSWWFEGLLVGSQKEYFGCHMVDIE